jgi:hypothetical protein
LTEHFYSSTALQKGENREGGKEKKVVARKGFACGHNLPRLVENRALSCGIPQLSWVR